MPNQYHIMRGFTLIELMIVVAIIAILASIAVPAYQGYIKQTKITVVMEHLANAVRVVKSESAKMAAGSQGDDIINQLNLGGRQAISNPSFAAFSTNDPPAEGQVGITGLNADNVPLPGSIIVITANPAFGTDASDYDLPLSITITTE